MGRGNADWSPTPYATNRYNNFFLFHSFPAYRSWRGTLVAHYPEAVLLSRREPMKANETSVEFFDRPDTRQHLFGGAWGRFLAWLLIFTLWIACCPALPAHAHGGSEEPRTLTVLKFATGILSAYALHETGHALAASLTDTDLEWGVGTYNQPLGFTERAQHNGDGMLVHASGLLVQVASSEVILQSDSIDKNDSFVRGMMFWNIVNPIVYSLDYWIFKRTNKEDDNHYQGDLKGLEHYSNQPTANGYATVMTGLAIYQGYRFLKLQKWAPDWITSSSARLNFQPAGSNGAALTVRIDF
jgi:hypothetical protein